MTPEEMRIAIDKMAKEVMCENDCGLEHGSGCPLAHDGNDGYSHCLILTIKDDMEINIETGE